LGVRIKLESSSGMDIITYIIPYLSLGRKPDGGVGSGRGTGGNYKRYHIRQGEESQTPEPSNTGGQGREPTGIN